MITITHSFSRVIPCPKLSRHVPTGGQFCRVHCIETDQVDTGYQSLRYARPFGAQGALSSHHRVCRAVVQALTMRISQSPSIKNCQKQWNQARKRRTTRLKNLNRKVLKNYSSPKAADDRKGRGQRGRALMMRCNIGCS